MRVDITVRDEGGAVRDLAVFAREGARVVHLRDANPQLFAGPLWIGNRQVTEQHRLGSPPLCTGAVLTVGPVGVTESGAGGVLRLDVVGGPASGASHPLSGGAVTIGRAAECEVSLPDPDVSRRHAVVTATSHGVVVRDCASTNGSRLDGVLLGENDTPFAVGAFLHVGDSLLAIRASDDPPASLRPGPDGKRLVNRSPRMAAPPADREIVVPLPPDVRGTQRVQWLATVLPAAGGALLAGVMHSIQLLIFALISPVIVAATTLSDRVHWRRDHRRAAARFRRSLAETNELVAAGLLAETESRRHLSPDPTTVKRMARGPSTRLWERSLSSDDALTVRVGLASLPSRLQIRRGSEVESAGLLDGVPLLVDLRDGPLGIAGPCEVRLGLARWVVAQLAACHPPGDVEIALLLSGDAATRWVWARWLPHVGGRVAVTPEERRLLLGELSMLIERRAAVSGLPRLAPWTVVVVDRSGTLADSPGLAEVLAAPPAARVTALCVDASARGLPSTCHGIALVDGETGTRLTLQRSGQPSAAPAIIDRVSDDWAHSVARSLAPLSAVTADSSGEIPGECRLVELLGLDSFDSAAVGQRWQAAVGAATVLGVGVDGPVVLDLVRDGPHVLIAGTTGAGKSELLQSLIAGLAATHPPTELCFVLVDYKGGAAFGACADLPHTTGVVTDLDQHLTARALRSLDAELRRRERLFASAGAADLPEYRASLAAEPIPRLVIVVDEFASLTAELPAFVDGLVGVARRGRSLGIHLILATQRPAGVVSPEIKANTAVRIALRVTDPAESLDVLGVPDAAGLDKRIPGRAYLQCGSSLVQLQVARVRGLAPAATREMMAGQPPVRLQPLDEWRRPAGLPPSTHGVDDLRLLSDCIAHAADGCERPAAPWLPPLPSQFSLGAVDAPAGSTVLRLGLVDVPARQQQVPLTLDLAAGGSWLIAGGPRSGRSTALLTIALAAANRLDPDSLHVHAIDLGGALDPVALLPHCGTVAGRDTPEVASLLLARLEAEVAHRQAQLARWDDASVSEAHAAGRRLPFLLLLLDGWESFVATSEEHDLGRTVERLLALLRTAAAIGMTVVIAGDRGSLTPRLCGAVSTRLVLHLADVADLALAGIPADAIPVDMPPGRAVRADDAAEVQFGYCGHEPTRAEQRRLAAELARRWPPPTRDLPIRIRPLPHRVRLADLPVVAGRYVLGCGGDDAQPLTIDPFAGSARLLVAGPSRSGRSTALIGLLRQAIRFGQAVVVAAPGRSPLYREAREAGAAILLPDHDAAPDRSVLAAPGRVLVLVDDAEAFLDTAVGDSLTALCASRSDLALVAAGRTDEMLVTFRGIGAQARRAGCCLLLHPGPADGELVGQRLPRRRAAPPPGRGLLVGDPAWGEQCSCGPVAIQVADL